MAGSQAAVTVEVPGYQGRMVRVKAAQRIRVTDIEGTQIGDMFSHSVENSGEHLSTSVTRMVSRRLFPEVGQPFYTNLHRPILTILEDNSPGLHDTLMAPCDVHLYADGGFPDHANCRDNYLQAAAEAGITSGVVPDPVNIFQVTPVHPDGRVTVEVTQTKPGDNVVFRAELDVVFILAACSSATGPINGGKSTPLRIEVFEA